MSHEGGRGGVRVCVYAGVVSRGNMVRALRRKGINRAQSRGLSWIYVSHRICAGLRRNLAQAFFLTDISDLPTGCLFVCLSDNKIIQKLISTKLELFSDMNSRNCSGLRRSHTTDRAGDCLLFFRTAGTFPEHSVVSGNFVAESFTVINAPTRPL